MGILQHPVRHPPGSLWGDSSRIFAPAPMVALWATPSSQWRFTCSVRTSSGKTRALGSLPSYMHQLKGMSPLVRTWQNAVRNLNTKHADSSQIYISVLTCLLESIFVYFTSAYSISLLVCLTDISGLTCLKLNSNFCLFHTTSDDLLDSHRLSIQWMAISFFQLSRLKF